MAVAPDPRALDPFDPERASGRVLQVPVSRVVDLLHVTHAPQRVAEYADEMRAGKRFPPISVVRIGPRFIIANGHKRFTASSGLGLESIPVELWGPGRLLADLADQNRRHLRQAARAALGIFRGPSGRREALGFVAVTVGHWRRVVVSLCTLGRASGARDRPPR